MSDIPMRAWEDRTRVVFILLGVQLISLLLSSLLITSSELIAPEGSGESLFIKAGIIIIAFTVGGTVTAGFILADSMSERLREMVDLVERQIAISELEIEQPDRNQSEVAYLHQTLNRLGVAYKQSLDAINQRVNELSAIKSIAESVNRTLNLQDVIDLSLQQVLELLEWEAGAVYIWEEEPKSFTMVSFLGFDVETVRQIIFLEDENPLISGMINDRKTLTSRRTMPFEGGEYIMVIVPLMALTEQMLGLLVIADPQKTGLTPSEDRIFITVAHQMSLAMDKARLHAELNRYARQLESLVEERTEQLNEAISELWDLLKKAQEAERLKTLLLSTVSHELRTPLMTIKGNISLLAMRHDQMRPGQMNEIFTDIEDDTDKLTELITNLLEFSRLEGGMLQINPIPIDLDLVIRAAVNAARVRIKTHPIEMADTIMSFAVSADPRRLEQVVANLIDNAAKYSPAGRQIRIEMARLENEAIVSVIDEGPGIKEEDRQRVFERFVQLDERGDTVRREGVGLGLAICKGLIEAHDGKIWVDEDEKSGGAAFHFSLPALIGNPDIPEEE